MGIFGKIVGGTIGFAFGGPLGAVAGAVFGHALDNSNGDVSDATEPDPYLSMIEETQLAFFAAVFSMLAKLAQSDGPVTHEEIDTVKTFAVTDLHLTPPAQNVAIKIFRAALESPARFEDFALQFFQKFGRHPQMTEMMIDAFLRVSLADGALNRAEEALILYAVRLFELNDQRYRQIKARYAHAGDRFYETLGCRRDDTMDTIKRHYRALVQSYHPDKFAGKELPEAARRMAYDKFHDIQNAYESIKKARGIK
ncbi:MAG: hypothetical protein VR64_16365 [Desulfatitalea sp. BRH_c12]|nr:MAG: hypothetical protein VR64_16365 [Desulfatitalea sp. BRH_c12]